MSRLGRAYPSTPLVVPRRPPLLYFLDDFNRANNADAGPDWTPVTVSPITWKIDTNSVVPATATAQHYVERNDRTFRTNNHKVRAKHGSLANSFYLLLVRANTSNSIGCWLQTGQLAYIRSYTSLTAVNSPTGVGTQRAVTAANLTWVSADTLSLEAINQFYIVRKNEIAQLIWLDTNYATHTFVDGQHRDIIAGVYMNGVTTGSGMDQIEAFDLPYNLFYPNKMTKDATTAVWPTAGITTFSDLAAMTAQNDATFTSYVSTPELYVITSNKQVTLTASVPFTGSGAAVGHACRIIRSKLSDGTADSTVVATGTTVTAASGTCTATGTRDVIAGEAYKIQLAGSAASAGTVTASTPSLTIQ